MAKTFLMATRSWRCKLEKVDLPAGAKIERAHACGIPPHPMDVLPPRMLVTVSSESSRGVGLQVAPYLFDIWRYFGTENSVDLEDFYMLVARALKTHSLTPLGGSLHFIWPYLGVQHSQFPSAILRRKFSSSSWNKFASATLSAARQSDGATERILQPAPALYPGSILSQKQKKVTAVVERALQATLTQAVSPPHLSPYIPYLSLSVLSISRDCYVVTIGWDCSGCNFSLADQHLMQSFLIKMIPAFRKSITEIASMRAVPVLIFKPNESAGRHSRLEDALSRISALD